MDTSPADQNTPANPESVNLRTLDGQLVGGVAWTAGAKWLTQILTWTTLFVTARLLSPSEFGISEMASYFLGLTNTMAEFGIGTTVLQMRELEKRVIAQLNTFSCMVACALFGISVLAVPLIAAFFHIEHLKLLILANNSAFLMTGLQAIPYSLLQRDMNYRRLSLVDAAQLTVQSITTVTAAWLGWSYWSLVAGGIAGKLTTTLLLCYWKPIPFCIPRWVDIQEPIKMGWQLTVSRLAWSFYTLSDAIVIGRVLGDSALGTYRIAMNLAAAPTDKVSTLLMRTAGPLFAKIQQDRDMVRRYFLILVETVILIVLPLMAGLVMVAPEAISVLLGKQWLAAVVPLQWLAGFMTLRAVVSLMEQILISQRATNFTMRMAVLNAVVMPGAFYVAAKLLGSSGVAATWILLAPLTMVPVAVKLLRHLHIRTRDLGAVLWPALSSCGAMILILAGVRIWFASFHFQSELVRLVLQVAIGGAVYVGLLLGCFRQRMLRYGTVLQELRKK